MEGFALLQILVALLAAALPDPLHPLHGLLELRHTPFDGGFAARTRTAVSLWIVILLKLAMATNLSRQFGPITFARISLLRDVSAFKKCHGGNVSAHVVEKRW